MTSEREREREPSAILHLVLKCEFGSFLGCGCGCGRGSCSGYLEGNLSWLESCHEIFWGMKGE